MKWGERGEKVESRVGFVRRIDAHLRGKFPNLVTRIFETHADQFIIAFDATQQDASEIAGEFDSNIRFMTVGVKLENAEPVEFLQEIRPLTDAEAAGGFVGLPFSISSFNTLVAVRFPDLPFRGVREDFEARSFHLLISEPISKSAEAELVAFADGLGLPFSSEVQMEAPDPSLVSSSGDAGAPNGGAVPSGVVRDEPMRIRAPRARPAAPAFVRADDGFWFENLEAAAEGRLSLEQFPGVNPEAYRCFIDFSIGSHVNLRQALLLYDEVYCSLPLAEGHDDFLRGQGLDQNDLLRAVEAGRLKIISTQPEERLHLPFLEAVAECRPEAIWGRRAAALLLISDVAESAERYRLRDPQFFPALRELSEVLGPIVRLSPEACLRALLWPLAARRLSIGGLLEEGTKRGPALLLAEGLAEVVRSVANTDAYLEAAVVSERVHLGHALRATVFPALDDPPVIEPLMATLGGELNFYASFNTAVAAAWAANEERRSTGVKVVPAIPLFEFEAKVPISEILEDSYFGSTRAQGRALMKRIAELPIEMREAEVDALADRFRQRDRKRENRILTFDNLDTGIAIASVMGAFVYPPLMGLKHFGGGVLQQFRRMPAIDRMAQQFEEDLAHSFGGNQDLDFLSKISRVARLRRKTI